MRSKIVKHFNHCEENSCIDTSTNFTIYIEDYEGMSRFYKGDTQKLNYPFFTVNNESKKDIHLACIDNCLYTPLDKIRKCDFAVFDDSVFCFVEIKRAFDPNLLKNKTNDAIEQLRITINNFKSAGIWGDEYKMEACICVGYSSLVPRVKSTNQSLAVEFQDDFGVDLFEGNEITFR